MIETWPMQECQHENGSTRALLEPVGANHEPGRVMAPVYRFRYVAHPGSILQQSAACRSGNWLLALSSKHDIEQICPTCIAAQVSLYWLVLVRLQQGVMILMLPDSELTNFYITVVLALVGQSVGLAHMLWEQIK